MTDRPTGKMVLCPQCGTNTYAIIPNSGKLIEDKEAADGKVWVNCHECGNRFLAYFKRL